jgi:hypothetical protein
MTKEQVRLEEARAGVTAWKKWGPYLSERQWGTVREDYSDNGNAWDYFTHDQARSRAYRWGEDGLAGYSDEKSRLCFSIALWNGRDSILKERLFGLTNSEGNHGEDVKEYYFYLDSTPTHSYMKYLYKYPQAAFPYDDLVSTNRSRSRLDLEYELIDTGVFDQDRYFDVFVEYAKGSPEDTVITIRVENRGPEASDIHILPTLCFRNTWTWDPGSPKPELRAIASNAVAASHPELGDRYFYCEGSPDLLFTENETNHARLFGTPNPVPYVKDAFHRHVIQGETSAVNPDRVGTKVAAWYCLEVPAGGSRSVTVRLTDAAPGSFGTEDPLGTAAAVLAERLAEADEFYASLTPAALTADQAMVMRQALAGMLWTKQHYLFDLDRWLSEHNAHPRFDPNPRTSRNAEWFHMLNDDIISMPDKWEYPWYAAWDLAFHTVALGMVDIDFAKNQLELMLRELYLHPNGQIPAYEWNFGDVNPPVHAWATLVVFGMEREQRGRADYAFLKNAFHKLLLNFNWWMNRKDPEGRNAFQGGFLGLDNIGVFDRSSELPTGGHLEQADGTAWMALFCQNMLEIATELAVVDPLYQDMAAKFIEHFLWIASAMDRPGVREDEMWDEHDGFFYDVLRLPGGASIRLKVRSMVGLLPLCATSVFTREQSNRLASVRPRIRRFVQRHPETTAAITIPVEPGPLDRFLFAVVDEAKLRRILSRLLDENEFLSPFGIRALSKYHGEHPYTFFVNGERFEVRYLPAESDNGMFGGNSNWRGPIWMPMNLLILRAIYQFYAYYGDSFQVECPTGSGRMMTLFEVGQEIGNRLQSIFLRDQSGRRPVFGSTTKFQTDPHWRDCLLFYEYFHGDNGAGIGASHQTGWTGVVARLIQLFGFLKKESLLSGEVIRPLTAFHDRETEANP